MKANNLKRISNRDKVLLRPNRFLGNTKPYESTSFVFDGESFKKKTLTYTPGLIKIIREVIDNSIDEGIRTGFKFANKIDISVDKDWITVRDNGRGIPVKLLEGENPDELMMPEGAWCELNTGANFEDEDDNTTMGQNGEGVALTNIFSKEFIGTTSDGKTKFELNAVNNLEKYDTNMTPCKDKFTEVKFLPDYERFGLKSFDKQHEMIIMSDLINLSLTYPNIKFSYNGQQLKARNFKDYCKMFGFEHLEVIEERNLSISIMPSTEDTFEFVHYINGLNVFNGGKPLDWVMRNITQGIYEKLSKKYPNIKIGDIKNKLFALVVFQNMVNPRFEDQIKSMCSNTFTEFKSQIDEPNWDKYVQRILKNTAIIEPITDVYKIREELLKKKELDGLEKKTKKTITTEKYLAPTAIKKYLLVAEGASAVGGLLPVLGRKEFGYYELKGKPLNTLNATHDEFMKNVELKDLYEIIKSEGYQYLVFATDADLDGIHIRGLGITFAYCYLKDMLKKEQVAMLNTPLMGVKKAGKLVKWAYSFSEVDENFKSLGETKYYKGLGSWKADDLKYVVEKDGFLKMLDIFEYDDLAEKTIKGWFGSDEAEYRREKIKDNEFSLVML